MHHYEERKEDINIKDELWSLWNRVQYTYPDDTSLSYTFCAHFEMDKLTFICASNSEGTIFYKEPFNWETVTSLQIDIDQNTRQSQKMKHVQNAADLFNPILDKGILVYDRITDEIYFCYSTQYYLLMYITPYSKDSQVKIFSKYLRLLRCTYSTSEEALLFFPHIASWYSYTKRKVDDACRYLQTYYDLAKKEKSYQDLLQMLKDTKYDIKSIILVLKKETPPDTTAFYTDLTQINRKEREKLLLRLIDAMIES